MAIVATKAAWPIFVADIIRVSLPVGSHFGEKALLVDRLQEEQGRARVTPFNSTHNTIPEYPIVKW